jgi:hypothetical protein
MDENKEQSGDATGPLNAPVEARKIGIRGLVRQQCDPLEPARQYVGNHFHSRNPDTRRRALPEARCVLAHGYDHGFTINIPLADFLAEDAPIAVAHGDDLLTPDRGGPARLIVPRLYAWKSAKRIESVKLVERDRAGFRESNGDRMRGDPWNQERYGR